MDNTILNTLFKTYKETSLYGRFIQFSNIKPLLNNLSSEFKTEVIGQSVLGEAIYSITIGSGETKVLMWSQMHGNESTTTKSVFDLVNTFKSPKLASVLKACTIKIIPMLNPDGSSVYSRLNANKIDLNRDAQDLSQPESKALRACFNKFKPDFCFNLHGQRTMYSVANTNKAATLSFLSPSQDAERSITTTRKQSMEVILAIKNGLQSDLQDQIGRYDDGFNINCVGDTFQSLKVPTILFEAGHFNNDYNREVVRRFVYKSLIIALQYIATNKVLGVNYEAYFEIPENGKQFYDILIREGQFNNQNLDVGINYEEHLIENEVKFIPKVVAIENLSSFFGHKELDANNSKIFTVKKELLAVGDISDIVIINNQNFLLNL